MIKNLRALALTLAGAAPVFAAGVRAPGPAFPHFDTPAALQRACDDGLATAAVELHRLERRAADAHWLDAYDAFSARLEDLANPIQFVSAVHPDKAMRSASEACELRWNDFNSSLGQNERLYQAARQLRPADAIDRELLKVTLEGFEDSGVGLPPPQRLRAKQLSDQINELGQAFERAIRDANIKLAFTEVELEGVPEGVWKAAPRDADGRFLLGLDYPVYLPLMQSAERAATRERMWRAKTNEGGEANLQRLAEIATLRRDYASLFGASSWAEFTLRRRMAETPARVRHFLDEVKAAVEARERREIDELRQAKAAHTGQPIEAVRLERWDVSFYTERVRRARYAVDQEAFRAYFPPQQSLAFALRVIERLMGVRYQRVASVGLWHPEVQTYAVSDASSGRPLGTLWVDLYPREGKYNHAAVWGLRSASKVLKRASQAALVVNFDRHGLTLDELETLLHELGHAVHNNLSATRHAQQAGTSVKRDFVEAPSQMLEDWVYDPRVLALFAEVCPKCTPVPAALIEQARIARDYGKGIQSARQLLYAGYDLALYDTAAQDPLALWERMEGATPLGYVAGTMFPAGFAHIASGYSAGYYGYLWSLVVALDLRTAFARDRLDAKVGRRYRQRVLARGSERPPAALVRDFLGRDFNSKAFFDDLAR